MLNIVCYGTYVALIVCQWDTSFFYYAFKIGYYSQESTLFPPFSGQKSTRWNSWQKISRWALKRLSQEITVCTNILFSQISFFHALPHRQWCGGHNSITLFVKRWFSCHKIATLVITFVITSFRIFATRKSTLSNKLIDLCSHTVEFGHYFLEGCRCRE